MRHINLGIALGTVALTGLVGAGIGVGYYVNEYSRTCDKPRRVLETVKV